MTDGGQGKASGHGGARALCLWAEREEYPMEKAQERSPLTYEEERRRKTTAWAEAWLDRHEDAGNEIQDLVRELVSRLNLAPAQPAAISLSRRDFLAVRRRYFEYQIGNRKAAGGHAELDAQAADALLAAAGLAWKAEAGEDMTEAEARSPLADLATAMFAEARRQEADAALGAKMRELLASDRPPTGLDDAVRSMPPGSRAGRAWAWLREQTGMDKAGPELLPEQIGWALDTIDGEMEVRLMTPPGFEAAKAAYAEAVRRYNLHSKIKVWTEKYLDGSQTAAGRELSELMTEGRP